MSYGIAEWGLGTWGTSSEISLVGAVAITTHSVMVTLSRPPRASSPLARTDALNPSIWEVKLADGSKTWPVVAVQRVSPVRLLLHVRTPFESVNKVHVVRSTFLESDTGVSISAPYDAEFRGVWSDVRIRSSEERSDLAHGEVFNGGLVVTEGGDYARVYGPDMLKPLILRRLTTSPGSYFHMAPEEYGTDLKTKELLKDSQLPTLKKRVEEEILKEPGVTAVSVRVSLQANRLEIRANVSMSANEFSISVSAR